MSLWSTYRRLWRLLLRRRSTLLWAMLGMIGAALATGLFAALTGPGLRLLFAGGHSDGLAGGSAPDPLAGRTAPDWWIHLPGWASGTAGGRWLLNLPPAQLRAALPAVLFCAALARAGFGYLQQSQMAALCLRTVADLQAALHRQLLDLPLTFFTGGGAAASDGRHSGELYAGFANDLAGVDRALTQGLTYALRDAFQLAALVAVSLWLDWRLLVLGLVTLPVGVLAIAVFARRLRAVSDRLQTAQAKLVAQAQDLLAGATVLQIHRAQAQALAAQGRAETEFLAQGRTSAALRAAVTPAVQVLALAGLALVLLALQARLLVVPGEKLISFFGAVILAYQPLKSIAQSSQWLVPGLAAAARVFAALDTPPAIADAPGARPLQRSLARSPSRWATGAGQSPLAVAFEGVSLGYGARPALVDVTVSIPAGQRVAIVGPSGAGKSTLLHLVARLLDPSAGVVWVGAEPVKSLALASLRGAIGFVGQDVFLFDASVRDNVGAAAGAAARADGRTAPVSADSATVEWALGVALALDFVRALPQGLDTRLGERGARLSGGERQRLALARALAKRGGVLLLDEAMSALDPPTAAAVAAALLAETSATVLWVTHRLSAALLLDRVLVLAGGRVIEDGPPARLRIGDGWFARNLRGELGLGAP